MLRRAMLSVLAVFLVWSVLDFIFHGLLLDPTYQATADLWHPVDETNMVLMYAVTLAAAACFVMLYAHLVTRKSLLAGIKLSVIVGLSSGISVGFGSHSYMPIPLTLAWSWFLEALVSGVVAGALVGTLVKPGGEAT